MLRKKDTGLPFELHGSEGLVGPEVPPPVHSQPGHLSLCHGHSMSSLLSSFLLISEQLLPLQTDLQELPVRKAIHPYRLPHKARHILLLRGPFFKQRSPWVAQSWGAESCLPLLGNLCFSSFHRQAGPECWLEYFIIWQQMFSPYF